MIYRNYKVRKYYNYIINKTKFKILYKLNYAKITKK